ncbi:Glycosyltransferase involved in cell wall bisynthesis [Robiginitalea myxolifaciens]|uniref:Glycosyltransferase involved in cell wall bisynthesis n=1 Tax=Robiginitalea myxolifaciens TaxID=400055 RepID=A0A1I6GV95_9FLAO|nr:glycosyltransferase family 2 protein [Robiginitalea myxolifaciens]SFR46174.1 Glycosyltransferase involved in cell wall bisynthesis [Robiginitalea myxolifaciens]
MTDTPLVSILIPYKNTAEFLPECLESILQQGYSNFEILAVNDNSADSSRGIIQEFAARDPRVKDLVSHGEGIIPALRTAFSVSKGKLVTRMDSDDIMMPDRLGAMVRDLQQSGKGHLAVGQVKYFSDRGISDGYARYEKWLNGLTATGTNFSEIYKECVIPSPCWMLWREDLLACEAFEPNRYPEDYDLCFRFYREGLICIPNAECLHLWRDYDSRTSRNSEHYAQNYFLEIKTHYFLELDRDPNRELFLWGAGFKGKKIARILQQHRQPFQWICDNPLKIGKKIYGVELSHYERILKPDTPETQVKTSNGSKTPQSIISVANEEAQREIRDFLHTQGWAPMKNYFFFC